MKNDQLCNDMDGLGNRDAIVNMLFLEEKNQTSDTREDQKHGKI